MPPESLNLINNTFTNFNFDDIDFETGKDGIDLDELSNSNKYSIIKNNYNLNLLNLLKSPNMHINNKISLIKEYHLNNNNNSIMQIFCDW
jgi:hypothetical protein